MRGQTGPSLKALTTMGLPMIMKTHTPVSILESGPESNLANLSSSNLEPTLGRSNPSSSSSRGTIASWGSLQLPRIYNHTIGKATSTFPWSTRVVSGRGFFGSPRTGESSSLVASGQSGEGRPNSEKPNLEFGQHFSSPGKQAQNKGALPILSEGLPETSGWQSNGPRITGLTASVVKAVSLFPILSFHFLSTPRNQNLTEPESSRHAIDRASTLPTSVESPISENTSYHVTDMHTMSSKFVGPALGIMHRARAVALRFLGVSDNRASTPRTAGSLGGVGDQFGFTNPWEMRPDLSSESSLTGNRRYESEQIRRPLREGFGLEIPNKSSQRGQDPREPQGQQISDPEAPLGMEIEGGLIGVLSSIGGVGARLTNRLGNLSAVNRAQLLATSGPSLISTQAKSVPPNTLARELSSRNITDLLSTSAETESANTRFGLRQTREPSFRSPVRFDLPSIKNSSLMGGVRTSLENGASLMTSLFIPSIGISKINQEGQPLSVENQQPRILDLPERAVRHRATDEAVAESEIEEIDHLRSKISRILAEEVRRYLASE
jgi:hypothetical protein